jgi:hypothetical protein
VGCRDGDTGHWSLGSKRLCQSLSLATSSSGFQRRCRVLAPSFPGFLLPPLSFAKDWKPSPLPGVLGATTPAFDSDPEISDVDEDEPGGLVGTQVDVISPGGHSDAQTLAMMLQEQLDAINQEIRWGGSEAAWEDGPFGWGTAGEVLTPVPSYSLGQPSRDTR